MGFSPEYVRLVLNENFEDAKTLFLDPLMAIHYAHLVMLAEQGIVPAEDARRIRAALDGIDLDAVRQAIYDGILRRSVLSCRAAASRRRAAPSVAGRLHTARSRNDIDMTMYRMRQREWLLDLVDGGAGAAAGALDVASRHVETIFPAHTHTQPAQPTTVAHYLLAMIEQLERDTARLLAAYATTNRTRSAPARSPARGFRSIASGRASCWASTGPTGNTYGSIATIDYMLEAARPRRRAHRSGWAGSCRTCCSGARARWATSGWRTGSCRCSSIMPQKRNPVALEHARALASKALAQAQALPLAVHNTPFGDIVDTEDDLQPLVAAMFGDALRALSLVAIADGGRRVQRRSHARNERAWAGSP